MSSPDIVVRIDRKAALLLIAVVSLGALAALVYSESLTLVTTYPAPSGIYNQLVTTGNSGPLPIDTTFNRNAGNTILVPPTNAAGNVGIGTTSPATKLDVNGSANVSDTMSAKNIVVASNGGVKLGNGGSCGPTSVGALGFRGGSVQFCDGTDWKPMGGQSGGKWCGTVWIKDTGCCNSPDDCPYGRKCITVGGSCAQYLYDCPKRDCPVSCLGQKATTLSSCTYHPWATSGQSVFCSLYEKAVPCTPL